MNGFTLTRTLAAEPARVWAAFTDAGEYAAWIWPADWHTECSIDLRVGGEFRVASSDRGMSIKGRYVEIDPITRIVMNWTQTNGEGDSVLTITLQPSGGETDLTLTQENFPDEASRAAHESGWADCLSRLPAWLAQ